MMMSEKRYTVKGVAKCNIRHNKVSYRPGQNFYAELTEKEAKFYQPFLENMLVKEKKSGQTKEE